MKGKIQINKNSPNSSISDSTEVQLAASSAARAEQPQSLKPTENGALVPSPSPATRESLEQPAEQRQSPAGDLGWPPPAPRGSVSAQVWGAPRARLQSCHPAASPNKARGAAVQYKFVFIEAAVT